MRRVHGGAGDQRCALSADGDGLFVIETILPGVVRVPIRRDRSAGAREIVAELPGTVRDGIALADDGSLLVSCYRPDAILRVMADGAVSTLVEDPRGQTLGAPATVAFGGDRLDRVATSNLGRWHVSFGGVGLRGSPLPRPALGAAVARGQKPAKVA